LPTDFVKHPGVLSAIASAFVVALASEPAAQSPQPPAEQSVIGSTINAATLADLPLGGNLYSALETIQPELIADRFNSSGLNAGESGRVGGFLASWSQTLFRVGELDVTDPSGSGGSLMFPETAFWQQLHIRSGLMRADEASPGLAVTLQPRQGPERWATVAEFFGSGGAMASPEPGGVAPPIARLDSWLHGSAVASGPLIANRLTMAAGGAFANASKFVREQGPAVGSDLVSGFINLVYTPSPSTTSRTLGWVQRARTPFEYRSTFDEPSASTEDVSTHVQSTLERRRPNGLAWRVLGGMTVRSRARELASTSLTAERLDDGPIPEIVAATGDELAGRWTLGARVMPRVLGGGKMHAIELGFDFERAFASIDDQFSGSIGETVDGVPARWWAFTHPGTGSERHATTIAAFARDRLALSPTLSLDAAIRFESVRGSADDASAGVGWRSLLPQAVLRWELADQGRVTLVAGYRRAANRLNLNVLQVGDPAAPIATVTRWVGGPPPGAGAPVIDRVGPGTGGDPAFSSIHGDLKRPVTDEVVLGIETRRRGWLRVGLTGIARREANTIATVDVGVPLASYSTIGIPDPGLIFEDPSDDQILVVYNRLPSSFGQNQYILTNPDQQAATAYALMATAEGSTDRLFLFFGATASMANGFAANRGFLPIENDQDIVGELRTSPNAVTFARGRLFSDRAFTIKWTTVYRLPGDIRFGAIARYQDGQPFSRLVLAPELNQGIEAVRPYPNGRNRFTFTGSLDLRLQKGFALGAAGVDAIVDFYNLLTRGNEVEEYVVTGPAFRTPTAIQPPRSVHAGLRVTF
jgi:hypothetical protein